MKNTDDNQLAKLMELEKLAINLRDGHTIFFFFLSCAVLHLVNVEQFNHIVQS